MPLATLVFALIGIAYAGVWIWAVMGTFRAFFEKNLKLLMLRWFIVAVFSLVGWWLFEMDRRAISEARREHPDEPEKYVW